jgi:fucose permease
VLAGVGGGALNGGTNTLVADLNEDERSKASALNLLGVFFGFGAVFLPFTIGALLGRAGVKGALYCAAGLCAVTGAAALLLRFPRPKQPHRLPLREMSAFARMPVVLALAILLFFQSGNEFLLGGYFASFLTERFAVSLSAASYVLAGYWAALMVARLVLARVLLRHDGHMVILWCALTAAAGCLLTGLAVSPLMAGASMLLTGAALAGIFPTVLGIAGARFKEHSGTVFGLLFTVALAGGMTIPSVAGQLGQVAGLRAVFWLAAAGFLAIAVLNRIIPRTARPDALVSRPAR